MKIQSNIIQDLFLEYGILNRNLTVNESEIKPILVNAKKGLKQYLSIQRCLYLTDTSKDILFQEMFSNFYGVDRNRNIEWKREYFNLFESVKKQSQDFRSVLESLYQKTNTVEASFSSKLVATIHPDLPVIDKWILINLSLYKEYQEISRVGDITTRIEKTDALYQKLIAIFEEFIPTQGAKNLFDRFASEYPFTKITESTNLTKVKMLDLILWQLRK